MIWWKRGRHGEKYFLLEVSAIGFLAIFILDMLQEVLQNNNPPDVEHPKPLFKANESHGIINKKNVKVFRTMSD